MPRNVVTRSISFEPDVFEFLEARRAELRMQRSEFLNRLILTDAKHRGDLVIPVNVDLGVSPEPKKNKK